MNNTYQILDETEYFLDDYYNQNYTYIRKNPISENIKDNQNKFFYKDNLTYTPIEFGEVIGSNLAKRTINNGCSAVLTKKRINGSSSNKFSYGVSSFYYCSEKDKILYPTSFIMEYFKRENLPLEMYKKGCIDIETCLKSIKYEMLIVYKRPHAEYLMVKQQFIDMIMFDCRFGNYDRRIENWMLYQDGITGEIMLYPLFDNETVLGFDSDIKNFQIGENKKTKLSSNEVFQEEKSLILNYNLNLRMREIVPKDCNAGYSRSQDIIKYIVRKYPNEMENSYKKLKSLSYREFIEFIESFEDLSKPRKNLTKKIFLTREFLMDKAIKEVREEEPVYLECKMIS
ncbi:MAG: hypothetical protein HFJ45_04960 [Clostridia bacterium]|nr:hypothetical protein [Clostridia bacterium]